MLSSVCKLIFDVLFFWQIVSTHNRNAFHAQGRLLTPAGIREVVDETEAGRIVVRGPQGYEEIRGMGRGSFPARCIAGE